MGIFENVLELTKRFIPNLKEDPETGEVKYESRPYTHKLLERNNPGLIVNPDGTYSKLTGETHEKDGVIYPTYVKGKVGGLGLFPEATYYGGIEGVSFNEPSVFEEHQGKEATPVDLPEVERNVLFQDEPLDPNVKSIEETKREIAARKRAAYNQARGITTADAYAKQKELRDAGYNVAYDGYWGDESTAAWEDYMQTKNIDMMGPGLETRISGVTIPKPSVTKLVTTSKTTDPNSQEANRQKMYDEQAAKIATAKIPSQFSGIDIMDSMKAEEARKKAELEALMQQQGVVSGLLNTDPHNIQGGYVIPKEQQGGNISNITYPANLNTQGTFDKELYKNNERYLNSINNLKNRVNEYKQTAINNSYNIRVYEKDIISFIVTSSVIC